jgi:hypothetical protein
MLVVGRVLHEISSFHSLFPLLLFNDNYLQVLAEEMHRYSPPRALFVRQPNFARLALARSLAATSFFLVLLHILPIFYNKQHTRQVSIYT